MLLRRLRVMDDVGLIRGWEEAAGEERWPEGAVFGEGGATGRRGRQVGEDCRCLKEVSWGHQTVQSVVHSPPTAAPVGAY